MLWHERSRSALAVGGILVAILLIFLQLGFYTSVPRGGLLFYNAMRFDLMLTSSAYVYQAQSAGFPRRRLFQALALPEVAAASAVYQDTALWLNADAHVRRDIFVLAFDPRLVVFENAEINRQIDVVQQYDTLLVDSASIAEFGALTTGRRVEIDKRSVIIGGTYRLGIGFVGLGVGLTSDQNFIRLFPNRSLSDVNLGLLTLQSGAHPATVAERLRQILPVDTRVFTRHELTAHETDHWVRRTSTGLIFGFGVIVAFVVGLVILNQTLSTQITQQLPQYATLKAMGYGDGALAGIVTSLAIIMTTISYFPAAALAVFIYSLIRNATTLPVEMTAFRMFAVLAMAWAMAALSALAALRVLRRADPVELF